MGCDIRYPIVTFAVSLYTQLIIRHQTGPGAAVEGNADYVPSFGAPQLFRWRGNWVEVTRLKDSAVQPYGVFRSFTSLQLM